MTSSDVDSAVEVTKNQLIENYDLDSIGLSPAEVALMGAAGRGAVGLARELKRSAVLLQMVEQFVNPLPC